MAFLYIADQIQQKIVGKRKHIHASERSQTMILSGFTLVHEYVGTYHISEHRVIVRLRIECIMYYVFYLPISISISDSL